MRHLPPRFSYIGGAIAGVSVGVGRNSRLNRGFAPIMRLVVPLMLLVSSSVGCLTAVTVHDAIAAHPSVRWATDVKSASMSKEAVYLQLGDLQKTFVRIERADLTLEDAHTLSFRKGMKKRLKRLPIYIQPNPTFPDDLIQIPVHRAKIQTLSELDDVVAHANGGAQLWVITPLPGAELTPYADRFGSSNEDNWAPILAVFVSDTEVGVFHNYLERPAGRRFLWFLTPLTVVGDLLTFPFQFIYIIAGGC